METQRDTDPAAMAAVVPVVVPLDDPRAAVGDIGGAKAANIARTATAGLPTLPGFVLTTIGTARGLADTEVLADLRTNWAAIDGDRDVPLVVRSSSTIEDAGESSMAGRFTSVLDVIGWQAFLDACSTVIASGDAVRDADGLARPLAVLVQVQLDTELGGVMFGVDPVTGATDHVVVEAVATRPDALVSGVAVADHYVLSHRGRIVHHQSAAAPVPLSAPLRRRLVHLSAQAGRVFGTPQDIEWAVDRAGALWLLQSRPVTAVAERVSRHAVTLGPGPIAETFPDPLSPLEDDLWIAPLREGLVRALTATGAVSSRQLARSPVAITVGGRAAVDLGLLGHVSGHTTFRDRISPSAIGRRLVAAWRVGRLRVALPSLAATVVATVDRDLASIPSLDTLDTPHLVDLLESSRHELATVHAYEVLAGMLLYRREAHAPAAPLVALEVLASLRARPDHTGQDDISIVAEQPIVLCLVPPSLTRPARLPDVAPSHHEHGHVLSLDARHTPDTHHESDPVDRLGHRDALRLRARWLHELQTRIVRELATRLADRLADHVARPPGTLDTSALTLLRLGELVELANGGAAPADLSTRRFAPGPPLPPAFRVTVAGRLAALEPRHRRHSGPPVGLAAGGGRGSGVVTHRPAPIAPGAVLVTEHLSPSLAALLPQLGGLIAETGSALSHLAILAREAGVPTVVGVEDARHRFAPGTTVLVDGDAGTIEVLALGTDATPASPALTSTEHGVAS